MTKVELEDSNRKLNVLVQLKENELKRIPKLEKEIDKLRNDVQREKTKNKDIEESKNEVIGNEHKLRKEHRTLKEEKLALELREKYLVKQLDGLTDLFNETYEFILDLFTESEFKAKQMRHSKEHLFGVVDRFNNPHMPQNPNKGDEKE